MNSSGLNGRWDEFSRILIGAAKSEFDEMCMMSDDEHRRHQVALFRRVF